LLNKNEALKNNEYPRKEISNNEYSISSIVLDFDSTGNIEFDIAFHFFLGEETENIILA